MSDQNQSSQEKSHEATPQKLERARKKGDIARSMDAQTAMAYLGLCAVIMLAGSWTAIYIGETLSAFLARPQELADLHKTSASEIFGLVAGHILAAMSPILFAPAVMILLLLISQRAIVLAPDKVMPKLSRSMKSSRGDIRDTSVSGGCSISAPT